MGARVKFFAANDASFFLWRTKIRSVIEFAFALLETKSVNPAIGFACLKLFATIRAFNRYEIVRVVPGRVFGICLHRQVVNLVAVFAEFAVMNSATFRHFAVVKHPNALMQ